MAEDDGPEAFKRRIWTSGGIFTLAVLSGWDSFKLRDGCQAVASPCQISKSFRKVPRNQNWGCYYFDGFSGGSIGGSTGPDHLLFDDDLVREVGLLPDPLRELPWNVRDAPTDEHRYHGDHVLEDEDEDQASRQDVPEVRRQFVVRTRSSQIPVPTMIRIEF